jgi:hypothetical protein
LPVCPPTALPSIRDPGGVVAQPAGFDEFGPNPGIGFEGRLKVIELANDDPFEGIAQMGQAF